MKKFARTVAAISLAASVTNSGAVIPQAEAVPFSTTGLSGDHNQGAQFVIAEPSLSVVSDSRRIGTILGLVALPATLIIGGVIWYLSQDGQTYIQDQNRIHQDPTPEDREASDKMLAENKDEVIAQGGQLADQGAADESANDRGMLAQTGSNTAARGLAGLTVIAMIAAGAFAMRRKLFA